VNASFVPCWCLSLFHKAREKSKGQSSLYVAGDTSPGVVLHSASESLLHGEAPGTEWQSMHAWYSPGIDHVSEPFSNGKSAKRTDLTGSLKLLVAKETG
jgi:hypothetical protein